MRSPFLSALLIALVTSSVQAAGPTGLLNDTGQTQCYTGSGYAACDSGNSGDGAIYSRQDGRFGRDPGAANPAASGLTKPAGSGGNGGFAFIPLKQDGTAIAGSPPFPAPDPSNPDSLRCVHDTVTNLVWEIKTDLATPDLQDKDWTYYWGANTGSDTNCFGGSNCNTDTYISAVNATNLCGRATWRLPTYRELTSIVDFAYTDPAIHPDYFPNTVGTQSHLYWSSNQCGANPSQNKYAVGFYYAATTCDGMNTATNKHVRLVADGP